MPKQAARCGISHRDGPSIRSNYSNEEASPWRWNAICWSRREGILLSSREISGASWLSGWRRRRCTVADLDLISKKSLKFQPIKHSPPTYKEINVKRDFYYRAGSPNGVWRITHMAAAKASKAPKIRRTNVNSMCRVREKSVNSTKKLFFYRRSVFVKKERKSFHFTHIYRTFFRSLHEQISRFTLSRRDLHDSDLCRSGQAIEAFFFLDFSLRLTSSRRTRKKIIPGLAEN